MVLGVVVALLALGWFFWHRVRRHRLRRAALAELDRLVAAYALHLDGHRLTGELSALLRRVCLSLLHTAGPMASVQRGVAGLTGAEWLQFLDQTLPEQPFTTGVGRWLIALPFQPSAAARPEEEMTALIALCRSWLQVNAVPGRRSPSGLNGLG